MKLLLLAWLAVPSAAAPVTFNKDIAPIVFEHCAPCHHPGGAGPFSLLTYQDARKHASQIAAATQRRYMPPWPPEHGYGDFADDRSLTEKQIHLIADWVAQNEPEGDSADLPAAPRFTSEWQMGTPDLVLRMPHPFRLPAGGTDIFRNFVISTGLKETEYVRGLELRVDNPRVVHHANVVLDRTQSLRRRDGKDGQPGFPGMDVITEAAANNFDPDSHFLFWKPGSVLRPEPDDMSWRLDPGTDLILNLHLQPTGKEELVQAEVGVYFGSHPPTRFPMLIQLEHDGAIHIPPGDRTFAVTDSLTLPINVQVLAIYPHAHYLGKLVEAWAVLPDSERRWLIRIPDWDINWQAVYIYRTPVNLPKGTKVMMRITYDNSTANPRNPHNPPRLVETGNRSEDEMGHVWLQVLPKSSGVSGTDSRWALQEAVVRRRLEKYPADFVAHYNLGALMQFRGKLDEAAASYRDALRIESDNATARNSLASVLLLQEHIPEAIEELRETLRVDPSYLNARYNLARALAASGDMSGSAEQYKAFLAASPEDAGAQADLGAVLFHSHDYAGALTHFREAARLDPNDADVEANLGTLLAITGNLPAAAQAFEQALRINPSHEAARANLAKVRAQLAGR
ncbi:MAG: tetratricopeptide repeat protein [Acidobacteriaceae bacterium]|nr:tetratricopeptide repeat protein [Acidobacteriaceae bacterium]MBV9499572.1 tetratricopeptide repeat protein [Acidobacteriaceae bacterium]